MKKTRGQLRQAFLPRGGTLGYTLERKTVRALRLRVRRDGTVAVSAPYTVPAATVDGFVARHDEWIEQTRRRLAAACLPLPGWGGQVCLLGRMLTLVPGPAFSTPCAQGGVLYLPAGKDPAPALARFLDGERDQALAEAVTQLWPRFAAMGAAAPQFSWRSMTASWGRCHSSQGRITLNKALIHRPMDELCYVVAHEMAHLIHPDHSPAFYRCLDAVLPDHRQRRARLRVVPRSG